MKKNTKKLMLYILLPTIIVTATCFYFYAVKIIDSNNEADDLVTKIEWMKLVDFKLCNKKGLAKPELFTGCLKNGVSTEKYNSLLDKHNVTILRDKEREEKL